MNNSKPCILLVDDIAENLDLLVYILRDEYKTKVATSGESALKIAVGNERPDLILLDVNMPVMDGHEVCKKLKQNNTTKDIPVIFVTARDDVVDEAKGLSYGAVDYIKKPISAPIVKARVRTHLALYNQNRQLEYLVRQRTTELKDTRLEIIKKLGLAAEYKDNETGMHVVRMSQFCKIIARASGMDTEEAEILMHAAPMHDIGKIGVPDSILLKPGKLNDAEWKIMKDHTIIGAKIIGDHSYNLLKMARTIALTHHEKWDGTGYPYGLNGEKIPFIGRIVALADVFDALYSERPYKRSWTIPDIVDYFIENKNVHFDANLVDVFLQNLDKIQDVYKEFSDNGHYEFR